MSKTPDLERAKHSLARVEQVKEDPLLPNDKYLSYAESLPASILMNGLGQAAAILLSASKGKPQDPHMVLYKDLEDWLLNQCQSSPYYRSGVKDLMKAITGGSKSDYQKAQAEALKWLEWLKKFARAYLYESKPAKDTGKEG
jgi:CRISPR-associated protein Cmr5